MGKMLAFKDPRAQVVPAMLRTISRTEPLYAVLENVGGLRGHLKKFYALLGKYSILSSYFVFVLPMDPVKMLKDPIRRSRLYFCLVRQDACVTQNTMTLKAFVSAVVQGIHASATPTSVSILAQTPGCLMERAWTDREKAILEKLGKKNGSWSEPMVVDVSQSTGRNPVGLDCCPCLTTSSRLAFLARPGVALAVTGKGKLMLHGIHLDRFTNPVSETALHRFAGNGMHMGCVQVAFLVCMGLVKWQAGRNMSWWPMTAGKKTMPIVFKSVSDVLKPSPSPPSGSSPSSRSSKKKGGKKRSTKAMVKVAMKRGIAKKPSTQAMAQVTMKRPSAAAKVQPVKRARVADALRSGR